MRTRGADRSDGGLTRTGEAARRRRFARTGVAAVLAGLTAAASAALAAPASGRTTVAAATTASIPAAAAADARAVVSIDQQHSTSNLPADFMGLSFEASILAGPSFDTSRGNLVKLLGNIAPAGHLRFGGSLLDNETWWQRGGQPRPAFAKSVVDRAHLDLLNGLSQKSGWSVELGVNLKNLDVPSVADEAAYAKQVLGSRLVGIACGNEIDLFQADRRWSAIQAKWESCANAVGTSAKLIGGEEATGLRQDMVDAESSRMVLASSHWYPEQNCNNGIADMTRLLSDTDVGSTSGRITHDLAIARTRNLPFRFTEANSVACLRTPDFSNTYGAALWSVDEMMLAAEQGVAGINMHVPWSEFRLCSEPITYTAICGRDAAEIAANVLYPNPLYYGMLTVGRVKPGRFLPTGVNSSTNTTAYTVRPDGGDVQVVVVQKDAPGGTPVDVRIDDVLGSGPARTVQLAGSALSSKVDQISLQGAQVGVDATYTPGTPGSVAASGNGYTVTVPTGTATVVTIPTATVPQPGPTLTGQKLVNGSGRCADLPGFANWHTTRPFLYDCLDTWNQRWVRRGDQIVNPFSDMCLDVPGARTDNRTAVQIWKCLGGAAQTWQFRADGSVYNPNSGRCLESVAAGTANGTQLQIYDCNGIPTQRWTLQDAPPQPTTPPPTNPTPPAGADTVVGVASGRCLAPGAAGAAAVIADCDASTAQKWSLSGGVATNAAGGACLAVASAGTANGSPVGVGACDGSPAQQWTLRSDGLLVNAGSRRCLDVAKKATAANSPVQVWDCVATNANQRWRRGSAPGAAKPIRGLGSDRCLTAGSPATIETCTSAPGQLWQQWNPTSKQLTVGSGQCLEAADTANGAVVATAACTGATLQQWAPGTKQTLVNIASKKCLDVKRQATAAGSPLQVWDCTAGPHQQWSLTG